MNSELSLKFTNKFLNIFVHGTTLIHFMSLDLIQSRKETREKTSLISKLMKEHKNFKAEVCDIVDCTNERGKTLCPDRCRKGT